MIPDLMRERGQRDWGHTAHVQEGTHTRHTLRKQLWILLLIRFLDDKLLYGTSFELKTSHGRGMPDGERQSDTTHGAGEVRSNQQTKALKGHCKSGKSSLLSKFLNLFVI